MQPKIYVLMGYSGAGKDSLYKEMIKVGTGTALANIKWSSPMKKTIADIYDIPREWLDNPVKRLQKVPNHPDGITWLDLMIRCFEHFPQIDPNMMTQKVRREIALWLDNGNSVCLTDTRNFAELEVIKVFAKEYPVVLVWVSSPRETFRESDRYQRDIFKAINRINLITHNVYNGGIKEDLAHEARRIINGD